MLPNGHSPTLTTAAQAASSTWLHSNTSTKIKMVGEWGDIKVCANFLPRECNVYTFPCTVDGDAKRDSALGFTTRAWIFPLVVRDHMTTKCSGWERLCNHRKVKRVGRPKWEGREICGRSYFVTSDETTLHSSPGEGRRATRGTSIVWFHAYQRCHMTMILQQSLVRDTV